jgi:hypothetical protein
MSPQPAQSSVAAMWRKRTRFGSSATNEPQRWHASWVALPSVFLRSTRAPSQPPSTLT